jgi:hypothetical protein
VLPITLIYPLAESSTSSLSDGRGNTISSVDVFPIKQKHRQHDYMSVPHTNILVWNKQKVWIKLTGYTLGRLLLKVYFTTVLFSC